MSQPTRPHFSRNGRSIREVSEMTGLSTATVRRWTSRPREAYLNEAKVRRVRILDLHGQGLGVRAIARELGCDPGLVSTRLKEAREDGTI